MKLVVTIIIVCFSSVFVLAREEGETEITTEEGIEVFQNEKYYLLKKTVPAISGEVKSQTFDLVVASADLFKLSTSITILISTFWLPEKL